MASNANLHPTSRIMTGAIIEGNVHIGENSFIGSGAILSASKGEIRIGKHSVIMENAIIRSSMRFDCVIGDHVLVGPKACISGAVIHNSCFIATNATIFHGAELWPGTVAAVNSVIHIDSVCPENTFIPIAHIAYGRPVQIYAPGDAALFHAELRKKGFANYVYQIDTAGKTNAEIYTLLTTQFLADLDQ